jgi:hypothetical protein
MAEEQLEDDRCGERGVLGDGTCNQNDIHESKERVVVEKGRNSPILNTAPIVTGPAKPNRPISAATTTTPHVALTGVFVLVLTFAHNFDPGNASSLANANTILVAVIVHPIATLN